MVATDAGASVAADWDALLIRFPSQPFEWFASQGDPTRLEVVAFDSQAADAELLDHSIEVEQPETSISTRKSRLGSRSVVALCGCHGHLVGAGAEHDLEAVTIGLAGLPVGSEEPVEQAKVDSPVFAWQHSFRSQEVAMYDSPIEDWSSRCSWTAEFD